MLLRAQCSSYSSYLPHQFAQTSTFSLPLLFNASQLKDSRMHEFNYGLEFVLLISFIDAVSGEQVEHALVSLALLAQGGIYFLDSPIKEAITIYTRSLQNFI
ncbi:hypothetical protein L6164_028206 [Bauhinia variegata]|uniref:Uncharacterized protein n=1 Tax=Bauhinia variegata TaxID=167791 RepID=A0ACB9LVD1_BAUVA|nr:hypothetical protein L6164_028206 [Bauhinia variegata]